MQKPLLEMVIHQCAHRLPVLLKRHPDFAFLFEFWTRTVSWICCWTWWVFKGHQDGVRLREEVGGERAKAATATNQEEYFKLTGSATSPPVSLSACTESPDGPTLPSAGRDGTTHSEGAFILQLHKSYVFGFRVFNCFSLLGEPSYRIEKNV